MFHLVFMLHISLISKNSVYEKKKNIIIYPVIFFSARESVENTIMLFCWNTVVRVAYVRFTGLMNK